MLLEAGGKGLIDRICPGIGHFSDYILAQKMQTEFVAW